MDQQPTSTPEPDPIEGHAVVIVPEHLRKLVLDYVAEAVQDESDVSGYLIARTIGSIAAPHLSYSSGTGCKFVESTKGLDWNCSDND